MLRPAHLLLTFVILLGSSSTFGQTRKPTRAKAPEFAEGEMKHVFFPDVAGLLKGELPSSQVVLGTAPTRNGSQEAVTDPSESDNPRAWNKLISATSLEDLVKGSKLRLEKTITTPTAFAGGGFAAARTEFSLQALLFAIIEHYSGDVRWKKSAPVARELLARVAANTKVGSIQSYNEAKKRLLDLGDLVNGSQLVGDARSEIEWPKVIDRTPLMKLLEWAQQTYISPHSASEAAFQKNKEELQRYAELVAVLGQAAIQEDMPDASDDDYLGFVDEMILQAQNIGLAVQTDNAELARKAAGQLGQSCTNCHDNFR